MTPEEHVGIQGDTVSDLYLVKHNNIMHLLLLLMLTNFKSA